MEGNYILDGLYIKQTDHGWGVFSNKHIKAGTLIERAIMVRLKNIDGNENPHLFTWSDDRKTWAFGTGLTSFYNHSNTPNIIKKGDLVNDVLEVYTLQDVLPHKELCNTYMSKEWRKCFQDF